MRVNLLFIIINMYILKSVTKNIQLNSSICVEYISCQKSVPCQNRFCDVNIDYAIQCILNKEKKRGSMARWIIK